jgi:hypothetical protein
MRKSQAGYLLLICAFMIVAISIISLSAVYMTAGGANATANFYLAEQAFFIADSGIEQASRFLLTPSLVSGVGRFACGDISGNANFTNNAFGAGTFTVTPVGGDNTQVNSKLTAAVTSTATTIPVASTTGFAAVGSIQIDQETMNYESLTSTSFTNVSRGRSYTLAASHTTGTYAAQYQCLLDSKAGVPNLAAAQATQEIKRGVQLQEGWAAGVVTGNTYVFTHWNNPNELAWTATLVTDATHKNSIIGMTMISNAEGWAVGTITNTTFNIVHYLNSTWAWQTAPAATCNTQSLSAVAAVSSQEAFAVGNTYLPTTCSKGNATLTVLRWNGTAWSALSSTTTPKVPAAATTNQNLNDVKMLDTSGNGTANLGFAVGAAGFILQYNGTAFTKVTSPTTQALNGVFITSTTEAWAVGAAGVIIKWNGTSWSSVTSPTTNALNSVKMIDSNNNGTADFGCAAGNNGTILFYNGTTWSVSNTGSTSNLFDCIVYSSTDVWAVGVGGLVGQWNGLSWSAGTSGVTTQLNTAAKIYPKANPRSNWYQVFD